MPQKFKPSEADGAPAEQDQRASSWSVNHPQFWAAGEPLCLFFAGHLLCSNGGQCNHLAGSHLA